MSVVEYMSGYPIHLLILSILFSCWNRRDLIKGYLLIMIGQGVICDLVKILVGRARPGFGNGPFHFEPFSFSMDMTSFPSGDACAAMALATL
ncbi:MAG: phosphatase PAP2 family protein, partial [Candidatus Omnitrophica bacterium]|nr:phosphatase PAP2 family protein [Candidatus Omnitrophota bacterium]